MDLKLQESWVSTNLFNYGKEIISFGSFNSGALKKISRSYQEVSELYPSIHNRNASIFTSAQSASMKSFDIIVPYFIALVDTLNLLNKEYHFGIILGSAVAKMLKDNKVELDEHMKMTALLLPRDCGGLPILPFLNLLFRNLLIM